jgi:hemoglobin-like flavoprotein
MAENITEYEVREKLLAAIGDLAGAKNTNDRLTIAPTELLQISQAFALVVGPAITPNQAAAWGEAWRTMAERDKGDGSGPMVA